MLTDGYDADTNPDSRLGRSCLRRLRNTSCQYPSRRGNLSGRLRHLPCRGIAASDRRSALAADTRAITGDNPIGAIDIILHGHIPPPEQRGPWMPSFAAALNDAQIADVLNWLRQSAGQAPWPDLAQRVQAVRAKTSEAQR